MFQGKLSPFTWFMTMGLAVQLTFVHANSDEFLSRPARPNIIIMMVDDMGLGDTSAYLNVRLEPHADPIEKTLRTPNLDRFAKRAMLFTNAFAPASMCSSTRYSLLTGRFAHRAYLKRQGWLPHGPNTPMIQRALTTLPEMLQQNGYHTMAVGKYHVGMAFDNGYGAAANHFDYHDVDFTRRIMDGPTHHGFHEFFGVPGNTEESLDAEPRIYIRNDRWTVTDRDRMQLIGIKWREDRILAAKDWDLTQLGPDYLREALTFLHRQADSRSPFFLYYVPNANHLQVNPHGKYAVPDTIAGVSVKGQSRYTDGSAGTDREDMVLENDVAFGKLLDALERAEDPRWPGHKMIENTLIIFTSDNGPNVGSNQGRSPESGGLRGKKARIWEGGIRVPFLLYWSGRIEGPGVNRNVFTLTDLYATLAQLVGYTLEPQEAQDSYDCLDYWLDKNHGPDLRPRVFFCHLGPPYLNDALAIRQGSRKLIVRGGVALPSMPRGSLGAAVPAVFHNLDVDLYETENFTRDTSWDKPVRDMAQMLLKIHNRGHARDLKAQGEGKLILDDGWHNLRNDVNGAVGFEFRVRQGIRVTHLGMWDDHSKDRPVRSARAVATEHDRDRSTLPTDGDNSSMASAHMIRLHRLDGDSPIEIRRATIPSGKSGQLLGEFRYVPLDTPVSLKKEMDYLLTMTTRVDDGDSFHDPAGFDGLPPLVHPTFDIVRSVLVRDEDFVKRANIPAFADLHDDYWRYRLPVGPTLRFQ